LDDSLHNLYQFQSTIPSMSDFAYDEFSFFHENMNEWKIDTAVPNVRRFFVSVDGLRQLSGLRWGDGEPEMVLLHGGAQNAHTYDTVALALSHHSLIALDLPGHGHSDPSIYPASAIASHALDVASALEQLVTPPKPLVGMSLGGLTALLVAHDRTDLVSALVLIDITPGVNADKARHITDFVNGPTSFDDFDTLLERTKQHNPTRSESSLRRGILHNAVQRPDGSWAWRHQQHGRSELEAPDAGDLWAKLAELEMPVTLIRAMGPGSVVDDDNEAEFVRRLPNATIVHVTDSGHSVQGDQPLVLAALLEHHALGVM
jgi:pimeloyl-ACP methyl ester carboxylesterase